MAQILWEKYFNLFKDKNKLDTLKFKTSKKKSFKDLPNWASMTEKRRNQKTRETIKWLKRCAFADPSEEVQRDFRERDLQMRF
jgi:hypothetical protein